MSVLFWGPTTLGLENPLGSLSMKSLCALSARACAKPAAPRVTNSLTTCETVTIKNMSIVKSITTAMQIIMNFGGRAEKDLRTDRAATIKIIANPRAPLEPNSRCCNSPFKKPGLGVGICSHAFNPIHEFEPYKAEIATSLALNCSNGRYLSGYNKVSGLVCH